MKDVIKAFAALEEAADKMGGRSSLSRKLLESGIKISPQSVANWKRVPMKYVRAVSEATGVSVQALMPETSIDN